MTSRCDNPSMLKQFSGVLTAAQIKQHIGHVFDLPAGVTSLSIHFTYAPGKVSSGINMLTLTVLDPNGFRGAGHRHAPDVDGLKTQHVDISLNAATPGYLPGALPMGMWTVEIDAHSILPDAPVSYTINVTAHHDSAVQGAEAVTHAAQKPVATAKQRPGWYRGDLHAHTTHSDATWDVATFADFMRACGLDFATLSDHNTTSGLDAWDRQTTPHFLTIAAVELTTFYGHCLALGMRQWVDWRVDGCARSMSQVAAEVTASGALYAIAHPTAIGDPICTGCNWVYPDMQPGTARAVEIWNTTWKGESNNEDAIQLWYAWLNQGIRMVATSGTDAHGPFAPETELGFDVVYADRLTEDAILQAIRLGHLYISAGPALGVTGVSASGATAMMGDSLPCEDAQVMATWDGCKGDERLSVIVDGKVFAEVAVAGVKGSHTWEVAGDKAQVRWCVIELRDCRNHLRAITNPIFVGW